MRVEGSYDYYGVEFDYKAYVEKGWSIDKDYYYTPPSPDTVEIEFVGFLPDIDLYDCLKDSVIDAIVEKIKENL
jgi:hypothetical protein